MIDVHLSFQEDTFNNLRKRAKAQNMGVSEYLMNVALGEMPAKRGSVAAQKTVDEAEVGASERQTKEAREKAEAAKA